MGMNMDSSEVTTYVYLCPSCGGNQAFGIIGEIPEHEVPALTGCYHCVDVEVGLVFQKAMAAREYQDFRETLTARGIVGEHLSEWGTII